MLDLLYILISQNLLKIIIKKQEELVEIKNKLIALCITNLAIDVFIIIKYNNTLYNNIVQIKIKMEIKTK
jgi:hypothetical protein